MYLFILCPPRHGSTILYKLLWTSPNVSTLFGASSWAGEGQFVPYARKFFRGRDKNVDWRAVKRVWHKHWDLSKPILCEKSPSNMCRAQAMEVFFSQFASTYFICMIRSPYARSDMQRWIQGAQHQRRNIKSLSNVLRVTYEELTNDPQGTIGRLLRFVPRLKRLDPNVEGVPGLIDRKRSWRIKNMNPRNTPEEIARKNLVLSKHVNLLGFHGYELLDV